MSLRMPRTIRLDGSDARVFERAAEPGEWAISGAFLFAELDPATLSPKQRQALANGFLGTASLGWSTFVSVCDITEQEFGTVIEGLARRLVGELGAPDLETARHAARAEAQFAAGLCDHPVNTLLRVERSVEDAGIRERFLVVEPPREVPHARIWTIEPDA